MRPIGDVWTWTDGDAAPAPAAVQDDRLRMTYHTRIPLVSTKYRTIIESFKLLLPRLKDETA